MLSLTIYSCSIFSANLRGLLSLVHDRGLTPHEELSGQASYHRPCSPSNERAGSSLEAGRHTVQQGYSSPPGGRIVLSFHLLLRLSTSL